MYTDESVKDVPVPEKYVSLKITTERSGYTIQKVYGHPNLATDTDKTLKPQPAIVVPTYHAQLTLFDASKGEAGSFRKVINVTRDAWCYLGKNDRGLECCRNIAFEPRDAKNNKYLTEQIHFPSRADKIIHGYFLLEDESQLGNDKRYLHAQRVSIANPYGAPVASRSDELFAMNVMFHIGGFYMARAGMLHAKWLGGSEGCFAFIPDESVHATSEDAAKTTMGHAFFSNRTWANLTTMLEKHRDSDPRKRFFVEIERRAPYPRDEVKNIIMISGSIDGLIEKINTGAESAARLP